MTRAFALLSLLLFLPEFVFGQSADASSEFGPIQIVDVAEVEVGFGVELMQAASILLNSGQDNTHWPLFAYGVREVFDIRGCDSFADTPLEGEVAFVQKIATENFTGSHSIFSGIRIHDASRIRDICESSVVSRK